MVDKTYFELEINNELLLPPEVLNQELHEGVDDVSLVEVTDGAINQHVLWVDDRRVCGSRINRDHKQDANDVLLELLLVVVKQVT